MCPTKNKEYENKENNQVHDIVSKKKERKKKQILREGQPEIV